MLNRDYRTMCHVGHVQLYQVFTLHTRAVVVSTRVARVILYLPINVRGQLIFMTELPYSVICIGDEWLTSRTSTQVTRRLFKLGPSMVVRTRLVQSTCNQNPGVFVAKPYYR